MKIGQILNDIDTVLRKKAFVPNPQYQQQMQQQQMQQQQMQQQQMQQQQMQQAQVEPDQQTAKDQSEPTDLDKTTVTLRLRDVLDLVSNGKATQSALKIQDAVMKQQQRQQQMAQKQQQQEQEEQMNQQQAGAGMLGNTSGIYPELQQGM